jgi:2-hydroxy-3-keto-5-methylthiopentenyl-1-phosphate phosphatase
MKKFAFVSDFDGTLTKRDFYHIIIDKYLTDWGRSFYEDWKKTKKINVEFLNKIFGSINRSEEEIRGEILNIPIDNYAKAFIKRVSKNGGDFYILSAGTSYYIEILLQHLGLENVNVISMKGIYKDGGISILPDRNHIFYSEIFGLDKKKVIKSLKGKYEFVFFAGDSEPDLEAAKAADTAFAKDGLIDLLSKEKKDFIAFDDFGQVNAYMIEKGWFS